MLPDFTPVDVVRTLGIQDLTVGDGQEVMPGDTVTVHYVGAVAKTGNVFQSSRDFGKPISFPLAGVIAGWTQGLPGMKVGGKRRLLIPAMLAYGSTPPYGSGIPADADLVFDIELIGIEKG
jgi:FKBP-type peptidyl-prolyl cis-trans isomerase